MPPDREERKLVDDKDYGFDQIVLLHYQCFAFQGVSGAFARRSLLECSHLIILLFKIGFPSATIFGWHFFYPNISFDAARSVLSIDTKLPH